MSDIDQAFLTSLFAGLIGIFVGAAYHAPKPGLRKLCIYLAIVAAIGIVGSWGQTISHFTHPHWQNVTHYGWMALVPIGIFIIHLMIRLGSPSRRIKKRLAR